VSGLSWPPLNTEAFVAGLPTRSIPLGSEREREGVLLVGLFKSNRTTDGKLRGGCEFLKIEINWVFCKYHSRSFTFAFVRFFLVVTLQQRIATVELATLRHYVMHSLIGVFGCAISY